MVFHRWVPFFCHRPACTSQKAAMAMPPPFRISFCTWTVSARGPRSHKASPYWAPFEGAVYVHALRGAAAWRHVRSAAPQDATVYRASSSAIPWGVAPVLAWALCWSPRCGKNIRNLGGQSFRSSSSTCPVNWSVVFGVMVLLCPQLL